MKIKGKIKTNKGGVLLIETALNIPLELETEYVIDFKPYRTSRSLEQNSLLWGLIQAISEETGNEPMDVYISALESANAKCEWLATMVSENELKKIFRAVKPYGTVITKDGKELIRYKVWIGSSKFDTSEMTKLIDYVSQIADELGIERN